MKCTISLLEHLLREDTILLLKNIMILCSISMHYLFYFSLLLMLWGKKGLCPWNSLTISSQYQSPLVFTAASYLCATRGFLASFCLCKTNSPLCCCTNKNTERLGEYFPVKSFADQRGRCCISYRRGDTRADESSQKISNLTSESCLSRYYWLDGWQSLWSIYR